MNTTERKADVLAVIDDVTNNILIPNGGAYVDAMNEARTTVAELIEAAIGQIEADKRYRIGGAAHDRLAAAIARVQGGQ